MWHTDRVIRAPSRLVLALICAFGCGSNAPKTSTTASAPTAPAPVVADDPSCPLLVPGTSISVEDTAEGPAFVFVTTGDIAAVRTRGAALAAMHNGKTGPAGAFDTMIATPSTATTADIEGGIRIIYAATDPASAGGLADELHMHGGHLAGASSCAMHH
jgi:hypothetical protein